MQYSYYPGCSMDTTAITYKKSIEYVCGKISMVLHEIPTGTAAVQPVPILKMKKSPFLCRPETSRSQRRRD